MKPTDEQLAAAVGELSVIPFFPMDSGAKSVIIQHLSKFVGGVPELRWLIDAATTVMRKWEGIPELRGLYCTRFKPVDGIEAYCSLPGYTAQESEMAAAYDPPRLPEGQKMIMAPDDATALSDAFPNFDVGSTLKRLPKPTAADKRASQRLLGSLGV